jgi:hypothetical protein
MVLVVKCLPSKHEDPSSTPNTEKKSLDLIYYNFISFFSLTTISKAYSNAVNNLINKLNRV